MNRVNQKNNITDFIINDVMTMSSEELVAELDGLQGEIAKVESIISSEVLKHKKTKFAETRAMSQHASALLENTRHVTKRLKETGACAKESLLELMASGTLPKEMTVAFRDGTDISDEEALGILADLEELGFFEGGRDEASS